MRKPVIAITIAVAGRMTLSGSTPHRRLPIITPGIEPTSRLAVIGKLMLPNAQCPAAAIGTMTAANAPPRPYRGRDD